MDPFTIGAAGASILGGLFGGGGKSEQALPQWLLDQLKQYSEKDFSNMFVPDKAAFTGATNANIASIMAKLPVSTDQFTGQLASRGLFGSGEGVSHLYSDVYAPIQREANLAAASGLLNYEQLAQQGKQFGAGLHENALQLLTQGYGARKGKDSNIFDTLGGFGNNWLTGFLQNKQDVGQLNELLPLLQKMFATGGTTA